MNKRDEFKAALKDAGIDSYIEYQTAPYLDDIEQWDSVRQLCEILTHRVCSMLAAYVETKDAEE